ncbi:MAG: FapA family protein [Planctomycetota bacterium]|jgi:uncharacterized protein (DUF342 family)
MEGDKLEFQFNIPDDSMTVLLDCPVVPEDQSELALAILTELKDRKIAHLPEPARLAEMIRKAGEKSSSIKDLIIVKGKYAGKAVHGRVEWAGDFFNTGFIVDEKTGAINYRKRAAQSAIREDQLLGRQIPYYDGSEGENVFGKTVPGEKARVFYPTVGENVRLDSTEGAYYAKKAGRLRLINDTLSVDEIIVIDGSVGIESGDVFHTGAVIVREDILGGSRVEAEGDIEVFGVIDNAFIKTKGNLIVHGGILQANDQVSVAGAVNALFLIDSDIEAGRDVVVEKEIVNCRVKTFGNLVIPRGRIVGGRVAALRGVHAGQISSSAYVPTTVIAGENDWLVSKMNTLKGEVEESEQRLVELHADLFHKLHHTSPNSPRRKKIIERLEAKIAQEEKKQLRLRQKYDKMQEWVMDRARKKIVVERKVYAGSQVFLADDSLIVDENVPGPLDIKMRDGAVTILSEQTVPE